MISFARFLKKTPGDSNFSPHGDSLSFVNKNEKRFVLLFDDLEICLQTLWRFGDQVDYEFGGDWEYSEGKYRDTLGRVFENISGPNSVVTNLGSQTPNTVRALELYAGFLLKASPKIELGDPELLRKSALAPLFDAEPLKEKFQNWLKDTQELSEKSVKEYSGAIGGVLSRIAGRDLYQIRSRTVFEEVVTNIRKDEKFQQRDSSGNSMYGASLNHYSKFLDDFAAIDSKAENLMITPTFYIQAILSKCFLILTGPSGTGKTRDAHLEALSLVSNQQCSTVAVGADWTDNRNLLGFLNPLESAEDPEVEGTKIPVFESTSIIEQLLNANNAPDSPWFLILDEMNLSHVERYFSDFLSGMELEDKTNAIRLHTATKAVTRDGRIIPPTIDFPENLFVIGTVNVDETTYMFSPKVLDRANVIEIRAGEEEMDSFLKTGDSRVKAQAQPRDYGVTFLDAALTIQNEEEHPGVPDLPEEIRKKAAEHLSDLFKIMKQGRFEFGFRTGKEVMAFLRAAHFLAGPEEEGRASWKLLEKSTDEGDQEMPHWLDDVDAQILQKILPKLNGSKSRLGPLLGALATYCATGNRELALKHFPEGGASAERTMSAALSETERKFPNSCEKLHEMIEILNAEQFVSFIC